jgi:TonB family protein
MSLVAGVFKIGLALATVCMSLACASASVLTQPEAERVSEMQPGIRIPATSSDSEVKIEQGGKLLVRSEGSQEWKLSKELPESIVVGLLDGDHKIYVITKAIKPPKRKRTKDPVYPKGQRSPPREGQVLLHMVIDERGLVRFPTVDASTDQQFTDSAIDAVKEWTFESAKLNGQPVAVLVNVQIDFKRQ